MARRFPLGFPHAVRGSLRTGGLHICTNQSLRCGGQCISLFRRLYNNIVAGTMTWYTSHANAQEKFTQNHTSHKVSLPRKFRIKGTDTIGPYKSATNADMHPTCFGPPWKHLLRIWRGLLQECLQPALRVAPRARSPSRSPSCEC
eukprot:2378374-Amphidinium_carterae.1